MAKFLKRLVGTYEEKDMLLQVCLDSFKVTSRSNFYQCSVEFKRGDRVERSNFFNLKEGENDVRLENTFNMMSIFFEEKDSKPLKYQEKMCSFKMVGTTENKVEVTLGEKQFDVSLYCNRKQHKVELALVDGKLPRNSLQISLSILPPSRMGEVGVTKDMIDGKQIQDTVADFSKDIDTDD